MDLQNIIDKVRAVVIIPAASQPDFQTINDRNNIITSLADAEAAAKDLLSAISSKLAAARQSQEADLSTLESLISRVKGKPAVCNSQNGDILDNPSPDNTSWTQVVRRHVPAPPEDNDVDYNRPAPVKITEALALSAISVSTFGQVAADGQLYYVKNADHFAFRLAGKLFHGNIGTIYIDEASPARVKNCRYETGACRRPNCEYYHPPTIKQRVSVRQSKEYRNFVASSWLYSPAGGRQRSRRFGSRPNLDLDIVDMAGEDIDRFHDQAMHDLLCSLLLHTVSQP